MGKMKRWGIVYIISVAMAVVTCMPGFADTSGKTNILLVFSWHKNMPWQLEIEKGLKEKFKGESLTPNLFFEYMDAGRFKSKNQTDIFKKYLSEKYKSCHIEFVIYESAPAARLFKSSPELFQNSRKFILNPASINNGSHADTATVIPLNPDYKRAAQELLAVSKNKTIYLVAGSLASGKARVKKMAGFLSELDPNKKIVPLVGLPMDRLFEKVSKLEFNSTIFYLLVFKDGNGNTYLPYDVATQISLRANAPVYSLWSALLGSGIVGGYLLSGEKVGHELGSILVNPDIVQNINAKHLNDKFHDFFYDWRQLKRWNIKENLLPSENRILFKQFTFYEMYYKEIVACSFIIVFLITFLWNRWLKKEIRERLKVEENLQKSENRFRSLSDAAFEGIIILDNGKIMDVNNAMAVMFDYPSTKLIGMAFYSLITLEDKDRVEHEILSVSETSCEIIGIKKNGTEFPLEVHAKMSSFKGQQVIVTALRDLTERKKAEEEIKILKGILPICMHCKGIRDDKGYWNQLEAYVHEHSGVEFSHGICPECAKKYYPDLDIYDNDSQL